MIYLSDDYVNKYQDVLGYIIGRAISEGYSYPHIEKTIAYSSAFSTFEKSDITEIAFSSKESIYCKLFETDGSSDYIYNPYDIYGWLGYTYIRLFFDLRITFETLFYLVPIEKMLGMYRLYHEMDYRQALDEVKLGIAHSYLNMIMNRKGMSSTKLADLTGVSASTISALRYAHRDINKLEAFKLIRIAQALRVKTESLLTDIGLVFNK